MVRRGRAAFLGKVGCLRKQSCLEHLFENFEHKSPFQKIRQKQPPICREFWCPTPRWRSGGPPPPLQYVPEPNPQLAQQQQNVPVNGVETQAPRKIARYNMLREANAQFPGRSRRGTFSRTLSELTGHETSTGSQSYLVMILRTLSSSEFE